MIRRTSRLADAALALALATALAACQQTGGGPALSQGATALGGAADAAPEAAIAAAADDAEDNAVENDTATAPGAEETADEAADETADPAPAPALVRASLGPRQTPRSDTPAPEEAAALIAEADRGPIDDGLVPVPDTFLAWADVRWRTGDTLPGIWIAHPAATASARMRLIDPDTGRAADGALVPYVGADRPILSKAAGEALGLRPFGEQRLLVVALDLPEPLPLILDGEDDSDATTAVAAVRDDAPEAPAITLAAADTTAAAANTVTQTSEAEESTSPVPEGAEPGPLTAETVALVTPTAEIEAEAPKSPTSAAADTTEAAPRTLRAPARTPEPILVERPEPQPAEAPVVTEAVAVAEADEIEPDVPPAGEATARDQTPLKRRFIQAGLYAQPLNATKLVRSIQQAGFHAETEPAWIGDVVVARVVVGPLETREDRDEAIRLLSRLGAPDALPIAR